MIKFFIFLTLILFKITNYKEPLHMLQQNSYDINHRYLKWIFKNKKSTIINYNLRILILVLISTLLFKDIKILFWIIYIIAFYIMFQKLRNTKSKLKFKITARVKRQIIVLSIIEILMFIPFLTSKNIDYSYLALVNYLNYFIVFLIAEITIPIEKIVKLYYKTKAKNKLKSMSNLSVIGITGSYGKTSSKNILADILNIKYNALPTPKSFNTPVGLMITINNYLDKFDDYFIAEMGAYTRGEIKELCDFVKPKYGILTTIGKAHLETFKSVENIIKGKFELIESLPDSGVAVLNMDDINQVNYKTKNNPKKIWIAIDNQKADIIAKNIKSSPKGTEFEVVFKDTKEKHKFKTKLLGTPNIYNILSSIALGREFGISIKRLKAAVENVSSVEHRLELKKYYNINIIDDSYNSNPVGSKMALDVLNMMPGKKIIVTPGMVELGVEQYELNKKFGNYIADVCDKVILVGNKQTKPIQDGLSEKKYKKENIEIIEDVEKAFEIIKKYNDEEVYVLLENDLPDLFKEVK